MDVLSLILIIFGVLALVCLVALFHNQWSALNEAFFRMIMSPIAVGEHSLERFWAGIKGFYRKQFEDEDGNLNLNLVFYQFIGSCLYTAAFGLFVFADFHLMCLTLAGMGIEAAHFEPPLGAGTLTVFAFVAAILFFGLLFLDLLGVTEIAPWREKLSPVWSRTMYCICIFSLLLSMVTTFLFGLWRGISLVEAEAGFQGNNFKEMAVMGGSLTNMDMAASVEQMLSTPTPEESNIDWIPIFVNVSIGVLFLLGGCLSGWGLVAFVKFLMLATIFVFLSPTGILLILLAYAARVIERIYDLTIALIQLLNTIGRWFLRLLHYHPSPDPDDQSQPPDGSPNDSCNKYEDVETKGENAVEAGWNPYN
jgi:hypothetical protein